MSKQQAQQSATQPQWMRWLPYIVFVVATIIFFNSHLGGSAFFWDDFTEYVYPNRAFAAKHISQGEIPYWNPYSFSGMPYMADIQTALFYPPYFLLDYISGGDIYPIKNLQLLIILHFLLAQIAMYVLCRRLKLSMWASMIAAVAYGFSSPLVLHAFHPMQVIHLAWFPLILRFFHEAITERKLKAGLIGGLLLGMTMLSGSPQMTLYMVFFLGCAMLWFGISAIIKKEITAAGLGHSIALGAMSIAIGVGLFCIQYFPSKELASLSERNEMTYEKASVGSLQFKQLITAAVPKAYGQMLAPDQRKNEAPFFLQESDYYLYWDTAFFFGIVTFFLGLFGAIVSWKSVEGKFFAIMAVFGFLFALGSNGFVFPIFFNLPFFNALRIPARMMFYFSFGFCVLAGYGFDALSQSIKDNKRLYMLVGAAVLPVFFALGVTTGSIVEIPAKFQEAVHGFGSTALMIVIVGFIIAFLVHRGILKAWMAGTALLLLVFIDMKSANGDFNNNKSNPVKEYQNTLNDNLKQLLLPKPPQDVFRVLMREPGVIALKRNQGLADGVMLYEGYNQLLLAKRHPKARNEKEKRDLLGIKYQIAVDSVNGGAGFVPRPDVFPNAWMVYQVRQSASDKVEETMKDSLNYHNVAVTEEALSQALSGKNAAEVPHKLTCTEYKDNSLQYTSNSDEAGLMCFSEIWYPAWKAYVDGKEAKLYRINYCLRGVEVPAGSHTVEMRFESESFHTGRTITMATLLLSLGALGFVQFRKKKSE